MDWGIWDYGLRGCEDATLAIQFRLTGGVGPGARGLAASKDYMRLEAAKPSDAIRTASEKAELRGFKLDLGEASLGFQH